MSPEAAARMLAAGSRSCALDVLLAVHPAYALQLLAVLSCDAAMRLLDHISLQQARVVVKVSFDRASFHRAVDILNCSAKARILTPFKDTGQVTQNLEANFAVSAAKQAHTISACPIVDRQALTTCEERDHMLGLLPKSIAAALAPAQRHKISFQLPADPDAAASLAEALAVLLLAPHANTPPSENPCSTTSKCWRVCQSTWKLRMLLIRR